MQAVTDIPVTRENVASQAYAWRIEFAAAPRKEAEALVIIKEPTDLVAVAEPVAFPEALDVLRAASEKSGSAGEAAKEAARPLLLLCLPTGSGLAPDMESRLEAWLRGGHPMVRAGLRTSRVVWSSDRAVIYASPEQMSDAIDAVVRFTIAARLTVQLKNDMASTWPAIAEHVPLTHAVTARQERLQPIVNAMTERVAQMKSLLLRLEAALEQLDPTLAAPSKRLFAELIQQAAIYERLEALEDPIEYAGNIYELANSRLTDAKSVRKSRIVEKWIVFLLAAELVFFIIQAIARLSGH